MNLLKIIEWMAAVASWLPSSTSFRLATLQNIEKYFDYRTDQNDLFRRHKIYNNFHIWLTYLYGLLSDRHRKSFISKYVQFLPTKELDELLAAKKPIIIILPHKGYHIFTAFALQYYFKANKASFHSFFDSESKNKFNRIFIKIFNSDPCPIPMLHNNTRDLVKAIRILKSGGIVSMFPDVFDFKGAFITTKLFGEVYSAMTGTAYLALKSNATIVPVDSSYRNGKICISILPALDLSNCQKGTEALQLRQLTDATFQSLQSIIEKNPAEWQYLALMHQFSHGSYAASDLTSQRNRLNMLSLSNKEWGKVAQRIYQDLQTTDYRPLP
jgi:lauroyl/myristoyl acyltransferase